MITFTAKDIAQAVKDASDKHDASHILICGHPDGSIQTYRISGGYGDLQLPVNPYVELEETKDRKYKWYFADYAIKSLDYIIQDLGIVDITHTF